MAEVIFAIVIVLMIVTCAKMVRDMKGLRGQKGVKSVGALSESEPFRCHVEVEQFLSEEGPVDTFSVKIRGSVVVPTDMHDTNVQVLLADVTEENAQAVLCSVKQWQMEDSPAFCFVCHNGRIPRKVYTLSNWAEIANVQSDILEFPRRGPRKLEFVTSIISRENGSELACTTCTIDYVNDQVGYVDAKESGSLVEILTLQLATAVTLNIGPADESTEDAFTEWINKRIERMGNDDEREAAKTRLVETLEETVGAIRSGEEVNVDSICREMSDSCAIMDRYGAMKLCLEVVGSNRASDEKVTGLLSHIADLLEIDKEKFRSMAQKILGVGISSASNLEFLFGISPEMSPEAARQRLNDEYQKWNGRVTHPDPAIQSQADKMLELIAEARNKYVEQSCSN
jgi:hypothetical protein